MVVKSKRTGHPEGLSKHLQYLEASSVYILREMFSKIDKVAMLWSFGKDSTVMLHLARKAFFGKIPFAIIHCDTKLEMDEVYKFRDRYVDQWGIDLITEICPPLETTDPSLPDAARVAARKTGGLKNTIVRDGIKGVAVGIRRDEEGTRAKERYFSPRDNDGQWNLKDQPPEFWDQFMTDVPPGGHIRIHPLLQWTEIDIWRYIKQEEIPVVSLYFAKTYPDYGASLMRFRSIGEKGITFPIESNATDLDQIIEELERTKIPERSGRPMGSDQDESSFERLRSDGYL